MISIMKLVIIFGPQAVGKMTVGHELEKITDLKLFHNHMTIELVSNFFNYDTPVAKRLVKLFREEIFKEVSSSNLEGLIFTYLWDFNSKEDWNYVESVVEIFKNKGAEVFYVELEADFEERIQRNKTEHRLEHKPTKRNISWSENEVRESNIKHRANSREGEVKEKNYIRVNNTELRPEVVANKIKESFGF